MSLVNFVTDIKFEKAHLVFNVGERIRGVLFLAAKDGREKDWFRLFDLKLRLTHQIRYTEVYTSVQGQMNFIDTQETKPPCGHDFTEQDTPLILRPDSTALELPFEILVHPSLFSTFVCKNGCIRYLLKLSGDIKAQGWRRRDEIYLNRLIYIIGQVSPRLLSSSTEVSKSVTYKSRAGEEVKLKVTLDSPTATAGKGLGFSVEVLNGLKIPLNMIKFALQQNISSRFQVQLFVSATKHESTEGRILVGKEGPQIPPGPGRKVKWDGVIAIPFVVPSGLGVAKCPNFNVEYALTFCLQRFVNLRVSFPLIVQSVGTQENSERDFEIESAYSLELSREFSASQFSLNSEASEFSDVSAPSYWTSLIDIQDGHNTQDEGGGGGVGAGGARSGSGRRSSTSTSTSNSLSTGPPSYRSEWGSASTVSSSRLTPPPPYSEFAEDASGK